MVFVFRIFLILYRFHRMIRTLEEMIWKPALSTLNLPFVVFFTSAEWFTSLSNYSYIKQLNNLLDVRKCQRLFMSTWSHSDNELCNCNWNFPPSVRFLLAMPMHFSFALCIFQKIQIQLLLHFVLHGFFYLLRQ